MSNIISSLPSTKNDQLVGEKQSSISAQMMTSYLYQYVWKNNVCTEYKTLLKTDGNPDWGNTQTTVFRTQLPGTSGSVQTYFTYINKNTLHEAIWRNNRGYIRSTPIRDGQVIKQETSNWIESNHGHLYQAQDGFIFEKYLFQYLWKDNSCTEYKTPLEVNGDPIWNRTETEPFVTPLPGNRDSVQTYFTYISRNILHEAMWRSNVGYTRSTPIRNKQIMRWETSDWVQVDSGQTYQAQSGFILSERQACLLPLQGTVTPMGSPLRIRSGPGVSFPNVDSAVSGTRLLLNGRTTGERYTTINGGTDTNWYRIDQTETWVAAAYVNGVDNGCLPYINPPAEPPVEPPAEPPADIMTEDYFMRNWGNWTEYTTQNPFPDQGQNCTWYAHGRALQMGYSKQALDSMRGHARTWDDTASHDVQRTNQPHVGAIAVWEANVNGAGPLGHVAFVERIHDNGTITISESNWAGNPYNIRIITASQPSKFLLVPDV